MRWCLLCLIITPYYEWILAIMALSKTTRASSIIASSRSLDLGLPATGEIYCVWQSPNKMQKRFNLHLQFTSNSGLDFINFRFLGGPYTPKKVGFIHHSDKAISIAKMVSAHGRGSRCSKSWSRTIQYKGMVNQIPLVQLNVTSLHILELHL